jgi:hypothetical protein
MKFIDRTILARVSKRENNSSRRHLALRTMAACLFIAVASGAGAAPIISQLSGTFNHKSTITINGNGFGTKAVAAPVIWDDASGTNILSKWSGVWPNRAANSFENLNYSAPIRGVALPHNNISKYIAGAGRGGGFDSGNNVLMYKTRSVATGFPTYTYASFYSRMDPAWNFGDGSPPDDNFKWYDWSSNVDPYSPDNWYLEYAPTIPNKTSLATIHMNDDGTNFDLSSGNWYGPDFNSPNPWANWVKFEIEIKHSQSASGGYVKVWNNGALVFNKTSRTDAMSGTTRSDAIGGYQRALTANSWRYFADVYLDYTPARVVLANNPVLSAATITETQIPIAWSASSISVSVNLGKFTAGQTAYVFVVDPTGTPSTTGAPVVVTGGTVPTTSLAAPSNLRAF